MSADAADGSDNVSAVPRPAAEHIDDLLSFGWAVTEAHLASAASALSLVVHWFETPEDCSVNADEHFGSDERTLRFVGVAAPTLIDQLGARRAMLAVPWGLDGEDPTLTVIGVAPNEPAGIDTRALTRLAAGAQPPFWQLEPGRRAAPAPLADVASGLTV